MATAERSPAGAQLARAKKRGARSPSWNAAGASAPDDDRLDLLASRRAFGAQKNSVERIPVASKALRSLGYDPQTRQLELEFASGHVYAYSGVPASVVDWLHRASNRSRYVQAHLAGRYGERRLHTEGPPATAPDELEEALQASLRAARREQH